MNNNEKEFINKIKKEYFQIGVVLCPAFNNQLIYFNKHGWNHLVQSRKRINNKDDLFRRLRLLKHAPDIIKVSNYVYEYRIKNKFNYWSFRYVVGDRAIIVVVRAYENNRKHFYSIMDKK